MPSLMLLFFSFKNDSDCLSQTLPVLDSNCCYKRLAFYVAVQTKRLRLMCTDQNPPSNIGKCTFLFAGLEQEKIRVTFLDTYGALILLTALVPECLFDPTETIIIFKDATRLTLCSVITSLTKENIFGLSSQPLFKTLLQQGSIHDVTVRDATLILGL